MWCCHSPKNQRPMASSISRYNLSLNVDTVHLNETFRNHVFRYQMMLELSGGGGGDEETDGQPAGVSSVSTDYKLYMYVSTDYKLYMYVSSVSTDYKLYVCQFSQY